MKQNVNYFQHDYNARGDTKLLRLRMDHGPAGYGVYFMLVEKMAEANGKLLLEDMPAIAFEIKVELQILQDVVNSYGLFYKQLDTLGEVVRSKRLDEQLERRGLIAKERRRSGRKGGLAKAKQLLSKRLANSSTVKDRTGQDSKEENIIIPNGITPSVEHGRPEINKMLAALKAKLGLSAFADSQIERNIGLHCVNLMEKIGVKEFTRRLDIISSDSFKRKNCNRIRFVYNEIKGFIEPKRREIIL